MSARAAHEIHVGLLVGRHVRDRAGTLIGRIADIVVHREGGDLVVREYLVGPHGWIHRFAIHGLGLRVRHLAWRYRISWDVMDLSDPRHPHLTCDASELPIDHLPPRKRGLKRRPARRIA